MPHSASLNPYSPEASISTYSIPEFCASFTEAAKAGAWSESILASQGVRPGLLNRTTDSPSRSNIPSTSHAYSGSSKLLKFDNVRFPIAFTPFVFFNRRVEGISRSLSCIDPTFCRITRSIPISEELKNERLVRCESDVEVIEFEHGPTILLSVKRPAFMPALLAECKQNVYALFTVDCAPTTLRKRPFGWLLFETLTIVSTVINATLYRYTDNVVTTLNGITKAVRDRSFLRNVLRNNSTALPSGGT